MKKLTTTILILFACGCIVKKKQYPDINNQPVGIIFYNDSVISNPNENHVFHNNSAYGVDNGGDTVTIDYDDYAKDTPVTGYLNSRDFIGWDKTPVYCNDTDKPAKKSNTNNITVDGTGRVSIGFNYSGTYPEYDTQKVIMLVCDTSAFVEVNTGSVTVDAHGNVIPNATQDFHSTWLYGYKVTGNERIIYLHANKKLLEKSLVVWQTKELK